MRNSDARLAAASDEIVAKELEGEVVVVNMGTGIYYSFNPVGSFIWMRCAEGASLGQVYSELVAAHPGSDTAGDIEKFADRLVAEKIAVLGPPVTGALSASLPPLYAVPDLVVYDDVADMIAMDPPLPEAQLYKRGNH